jgi:hypothetical protein
MRAFLALAALTVLATPTSVFAANPQRQNPYANLFTGQLGGIPQQKPPAPPNAAPKFVMPQVSPLPPASALIVKCGMTIIHGYATLDPKILIEKPPAPNGSKPIIGVKPAPACQE